MSPFAWSKGEGSYNEDLISTLLMPSLESIRLTGKQNRVRLGVIHLCASTA